MKSNFRKSTLIIPVAALAVVAGTAQAFNSEILEQAGLSDDQIAAFEAAHELRHEGNHTEARDMLAEAGIDQDTMQNIRETMHEVRESQRDAIQIAIATNDYSAFMSAVADTPLAEHIVSEADFAQFVEAHELRAEADQILSELGIKHGEGFGGIGHTQARGGFGHRGMMMSDNS